ncbi:hypothetical protein N4R57_10870 [Rhodobacteraceae bacterium D3-12]|nr:hypothetical protein N4R57_10870 [Rhodobacteraceae bacterium D3-12]
MKKHASRTRSDMKMSHNRNAQAGMGRICHAGSVLGVGLILCLSGCATTTPTPKETGSGARVTAAYFTDDPAALIAAAKGACADPGETFVQPRDGVTQCRLLLDPQTTAAAILSYDGDIKALPQLVISLSTSPAGDGHLVAGCAFLKVPHKDGRVSRIVQNDRTVHGQLREMFDAIGGKPVREVPQEIAKRCYAL